MDDIFVDIDSVDYYDIFKHSQISKIEQIYPTYLLIEDSPSFYYHTPKEVFPELVVGGIYDIIIKGAAQEDQYIYTERGTLRSIHPHKPDIYDGDTILTCIFVEDFFMKPHRFYVDEDENIYNYIAEEGVVYICNLYTSDYVGNFDKQRMKEVIYEDPSGNKGSPVLVWFTFT